MIDYKEILRLCSNPESGQRKIAAMAHCGRDTVRDVQRAAQEAGVAWPLDEDVTNEELRDILFPKRFAVESKYAKPDYAYIHRELSKPGVNLGLSLFCVGNCAAPLAVPPRFILSKCRNSIKRIRSRNHGNTK